MNNNALENFEKNHKPSAKKSVFLEYIEDIEYLLSKGFSRKQVYGYLQQTYKIVETIDALYKFLKKHNLKPFLKNPIKVEEEIKKEPVKEEEIKLKPTAPEPKPQPATPKPKEPEPKQEQKVKTPADRKKEFKRYLEHWDRQPENYLQYLEDKQNEKNFNAVMNKLIEEKLITSFEDIENTFKEPYRPEFICEYISVCRQKLINKENFKAFTPAMFKHYMVDNFFAKRPPEQL